MADLKQAAALLVKTATDGRKTEQRTAEMWPEGQGLLSFGGGMAGVGRGAYGVFIVVRSRTLNWLSRLITQGHE